MILPPPRSTLFPYTTLFRSKQSQTNRKHSSNRIGNRTYRNSTRFGAFSSRAVPVSTIPNSDRKSTRLNSSHANISYAVFCLKKKNIAKRETITTHPVHLKVQ